MLCALFAVGRTLAR